LASLAQRFGHAEITSIVRQRDPWARQAVAEFSRGEAAKGLLRYAERGLVHVAKTAEQAIRTLVSTYAKDGLGAECVRDKCIFASTNREASNINQRVQRERLSAGELGRRVQVGSSYLHEQDRVLFTRNNRVLGVKNGMLGTVEHVDFLGRSLAIRLDGHQRRLVRVSLKHYEHLQPGYAITTHRGQGCTTTNAFVLVGANTDLHLSYVAMSRARGETRIFCDRREAGDELEHLAKSMARDRSKDLAHDVLRTQEPTHEYGRQLGRS
jgi:ATP-dependent exoDNAse (exonuclease V) alpha subunit